MSIFPGEASRKRDYLIAFLALAFCFLLFLATLALVLSLHQISQQRDILTSLVNQTENMAREGQRIINRLNARPSEECTESLLQDMRRELFFASTIADIGYTDNGYVICTTGIGVLDQPVKETTSYFLGSAAFRFWPAAKLIMFNGEITAPVAGKGNFNVVFDPRSLNNNLPEGYRWELVFVGGQQSPQHAFGSRGIFLNRSGHDHQVTLSQHYLESCSNQIPYCAGLAIKNSWLISNNLMFLTFLLVLGGLISASFGLFFSLFLRKRFSNESRILRGIGSEAFYPLYQPIIELKTGRVIGCEVLARFEDVHGPLYPDIFIPELARLNKSWRFTGQLLQQSLRELSDDPIFPAGFKVNFNAFPGDIMTGQIKAIESMALCMQSRFRIAFEITEDEKLDSLAARSTLRWLREQGFELAVDDFGTGYSNFSKLQELACHSLKIDRAFVTDMENGGVKATLVPLMIQMAQELSMEVVVEGIENQKQAQIVNQLGATYGQGWYYAKPITALALSQFMASA